jgi:hypothetical protein
MNAHHVRIVRIGWNETSHGHHGKPDRHIDLDYSTGHPCFKREHIVRDEQGCRYTYTFVPVMAHLRSLIDHHRICRIWSFDNEGSMRCIYWYLQGVLSEGLFQS